MIAVVLILVLGFALFFRSLDVAEREARKRFNEELRKELSETRDAGDVKKWTCPPHRWSHHPQTDLLTCTECNFVAGSYDPKNNGDYDF